MNSRIFEAFIAGAAFGIAIGMWSPLASSWSDLTTGYYKGYEDGYDFGRLQGYELGYKRAYEQCQCYRCKCQAASVDEVDGKKKLVGSVLCTFKSKIRSKIEF